jgi:hypothetical protein
MMPGDGVDADAAGGVLDGQRPGNRQQAALRQRGQRGWLHGVRVVRDAGAEVDDTAAALLQHLADGALGQPGESGEVDAGDQRVVLGGVVGEWLGDADACVFDQGVDARSMAWPMICPAAA